MNPVITTSCGFITVAAIVIGIMLYRIKIKDQVKEHNDFLSKGNGSEPLIEETFDK